MFEVIVRLPKRSRDGLQTGKRSCATGFSPVVYRPLQHIPVWHWIRNCAEASFYRVKPLGGGVRWGSEAWM